MFLCALTGVNDTGEDCPKDNRGLPPAQVSLRITVHRKGPIRAKLLFVETSVAKRSSAVNRKYTLLVVSFEVEFKLHSD